MKYIYIIVLLVLLFFAKKGITQTESLSLLFVGDIMGHEDQIKSATIVKNEIYDYESCFKYVRPIIEKADIAIGNLEVVFSGEPPYQGFPYFKSPDALAAALRKTGFDILTTANNHSNDDNKRGLIHSIDVLQQNHILQTGTFKNQQERALHYPLVVYKKGFKLAFLSCTFSTNKRKTRPPTLVNMIDKVELKADIEEANRLGIDAIIMLIHWGREYDLKENREQERLAKWLFQNGVDLVIGSHPHVVQPIKYLDCKNKTGERKQGLVVYSLGNFISGQQKLDTDGGIMVELDLVKKIGSDAIIIENVAYIPVWRFIKKGKSGGTNYYTLPLAAFEDKQVDIGLRSKDHKAMAIFASRTRKRLEEAACLERKIDWDDLYRTCIQLINATFGSIQKKELKKEKEE